MTLLDVVTSLDSFDDEATIYATIPWSPASTAVVVTERTEPSLPPQATACGATYFLEVFVAIEFLGAWLANVDPNASPVQQCERLVEYAVNDA